MKGVLFGLRFQGRQMAEGALTFRSANRNATAVLDGLLVVAGRGKGEEKAFFAKPGLVGVAVLRNEAIYGKAAGL